MKYLLMTAMPLPGVTWPVRHEIGGALIFHPLGETQQNPYIIVGGLRTVGRAECRHIYENKKH